MLYPLEDVRAKLDRADEHLNVLDKLIGSYFEDEPYRFVGEEQIDGEWRRHSFFLETVALPPDDVWGPIIGDAVHNLRSALDHLAWNIAVPEWRERDPRSVQFPIFLDNPETDAQARRLLAKQIKRLRPEAQAIIEAAQPYKTGNSHHPLWLLQALWNTDKHRVLHTAGFLYTPSRHLDPDSLWGYTGWGWGPFVRGESTVSRTHLETLRERAESFDQYPTLQSRVDAYKGFAVDVSLGHLGFFPSRDDEPYGGLPIRQMLRRVQRYVVEEIVPSLHHLL